MDGRMLINITGKTPVIFEPKISILQTYEFCMNDK